MVFFKMKDINIVTTNLSKLSQEWAVYIIFDGITAKVEYVGMCLMSQLFSIPDAFANSAFIKMFPDGHPVILRVDDVFKIKAEAIKRQAILINDHQLYKIMALGRFGRSAPIICNETGETFPTLADAARAHGIAAGNLSNHLNHKPGFRSLRNRTYSRRTN